MGRKKIDLTKTTCSNCPAIGGYMSKGLCRKCYQAAYYKVENLDPDKAERRRKASREWNREHREQFNARKRASYNKSVGNPYDQAAVRTRSPQNSGPCIDCGGPPPQFSAGRCLSCYQKNRHRNRTEEERVAQLAKRHNITSEHYANLMSRAEGKCEVCSKPTASLVIDHDHSTGKVRAAICGHCNLMIGHMEKAGALVVAAAQLYLEKHSPSPQNLPDYK